MKTVQINKELLDKICEDLIPVIIEYQKAVERNRTPEPTDFTEDLERVSQHIEAMRKLRTEVSANIGAENFWGMLLRSKIEMIGAIGKTDLIKEVYHHLEKHELNERYRLASAFSIMAHGIADWVH